MTEVEEGWREGGVSTGSEGEVCGVDICGIIGGRSPEVEISAATAGSSPYGLKAMWGVAVPPGDQDL